MSDGRLTKNASSTFRDTSICQSVSKAAPKATRQNRTAGPKAPSFRVAAAASATPQLHRLLALDDFLAKHCPDRAIELDECRRRAQLHQIARPIERHRLARNDVRGRAGRKDDDLVGQRDCFLEIVRHEYDGLS